MAKTRSISHQVIEKTMCVMNRILVLTLFYDIGYVIVIIISVIEDNMTDTARSYTYIPSGLSYQFVSVMTNYSMFLMQQHNTKEYNTFLKIVHDYSLYCIFGCCCCKPMIENDLYSPHSMNSETEQGNDGEMKRLEAIISDTLVHSNDVRIEIRPMDSSPATTNVTVD